MEYWDKTDNMISKEEMEQLSKMVVELKQDNGKYIVIYNKISVGEIVLFNYYESNAEMRITINGPYQNRGIGTKAIKEMIRIAKEELKLNTLTVKIAMDDSKSQLVFCKNLFDLSYRIDEYLMFKRVL